MSLVASLKERLKDSRIHLLHVIYFTCLYTWSKLLTWFFFKETTVKMISTIMVAVLTLRLEMFVFLPLQQMKIPFLSIFAAFSWVKRSSETHISMIHFKLQCSKIQIQNNDTYCTIAQLTHHSQLIVKFWLRLRPRSATVSTCRGKETKLF